MDRGIAGGCVLQACLSSSCWWDPRFVLILFYSRDFTKRRRSLSNGKQCKESIPRALLAEVPCDSLPARPGLPSSFFHLLWLQVIWRRWRHQTICSVKPQQWFPPELFVLWQLLWAIFNIHWAETEVCSKQPLSIAVRRKHWRRCFLYLHFFKKVKIES